MFSLPAFPSSHWRIQEIPWLWSIQKNQVGLLRVASGFLKPVVVEVGTPQVFWLNTAMSPLTVWSFLACFWIWTPVSHSEFINNFLELSSPLRLLARCWLLSRGDGRGKGRRLDLFCLLHYRAGVIRVQVMGTCTSAMNQYEGHKISRMDFLLA